MSISIEVNNRHTRSVNLDRDSGSEEFIRGYIPTSRALRTLEKISDSIEAEVAQRSWSLIGPYGSGKSSFALFVAHLLGPVGKHKSAAFEVLRETAPGLADRLQTQPTNCLVISVVGAPEALGLRLLQAVYDQATFFYGARKGRNPRILQDIEQALSRGEVKQTEFLNYVKTLAIELKRCGLTGMVFVIDELGKFLEYEVRHYGANDIYLLQSLAEESASTGDFFILNFVLLHQSMERYAKGLSETLRNEWGKIQGRFEEIPFLESTEQTLKVVGRVFKRTGTAAELKKVDIAVKNVVNAEAFSTLLPTSLDEDSATELFKNCYPLHPVTAFLLPYLCQKIAQNERTLFSYLGSREDFGVLSMLEQLDPGQFVLPHHAFDYFVRNQSLAVSDFVTQKRWVEVITTLDRAADLNANEVSLLKSIGLLNIVGVKGNLKASEELLRICSGLDDRSFNRCIKKLKENSLISFRKFSGEFRIWQGSDFDLDQAVTDEISNLGQFSVADELNLSELLQPIVAKRYTIENASLRYFRPLFVDAKTYLKAAQTAEDPRIVFFLSFGADDGKTFALLNKFFSTSDVLVECASSDHIRNAVSEVIALRRVGSANHELERDPVAKREFQERLNAAEQAEKAVLNAFLEQPEIHRWEHEGQKLDVNCKKDLQVSLSACLQAIYPKAPIFRNELINRDRPSGQAVMARNKLMAAMNNHASTPELGFPETTFPAEKAIYRALFSVTGIHRVPTELGALCEFVKPAGLGVGSVLPVWNCIEAFIASTTVQQRSFVELNETLMRPPFGVKAGVLPLLYFAVYLVNQSAIGVFENRRFRPRFTDEMIERFAKRPDEFTIQYFKIEGLNESIFNQYERAFAGGVTAPKTGKKKSVLNLVKPLAAFMGSLPEYTQTTREGLSDRAQKVRSAFNLAKSPNDLIFYDLPSALGFSGSNGMAGAELEDFSTALTEVIQEFSRCHERLITRFKEVLNEGLGREVAIDLAECRRTCGNLYGLEQYSQDVRLLGGFIARLTKVQVEDSEWFENVLMYLGRKPTKKWTDTDCNTALFRLKDFLRQINDLEKIRLETKGAYVNDPNVDFYLLKAIRKGGAPLDRVVVIDHLTEEAIAQTLKALSKELMNLDDELRGACLARLMMTVLGQQEATGDEALPVTELDDFGDML